LRTIYGVPGRPGRRCYARAAALALLAVGAQARADGAFPDTFTLLLASDRPNEVVVATNFGLMVSEDFGGSWSYVCENAMGGTSNSFLYEVGPAPADRFYEEALQGLAFSGSGDDACAFDAGVTPYSQPSVQDAFPDPNDALHVLALVEAQLDGGAFADLLLESNDGAATFSTQLYSATAPVQLTGVEISRSVPDTYYMTGFSSSATVTPLLFKTVDRGGTWQSIDLSGAAPGFIVRLAAVDPTNADVVYLRAVLETDPTQGGLLKVSDGGASVDILFNSGIDAFLRRADGSLLINSGNQAYLSTDDETFVPWGACGQVRSFAERDGGIFALTNCSRVYVSWDDGDSWNKLLDSFGQISGPRTCGAIPSLCAADWNGTAAGDYDNQARFAEEQQQVATCVDQLLTCRTQDGGSPPPADGGNPSPDGGTADAGAPDGGSTAAGGGCGCAVGFSLPLAWTALAAWAFLRRRLRQKTALEGR
jgi:hypothetical protein